jgi:hypothetical protein
MVEVGKEIFGHLGYSDGSRFFTVDDPQVAQLQTALTGAQTMIQQLQQQLKEKTTAQVIGLQKTRETNQTKERIAGLHEVNENKRSLATHFTAIMSKDKDRHARSRTTSRSTEQS